MAALRAEEERARTGGDAEDGRAIGGPNFDPNPPQASKKPSYLTLDMRVLSFVGENSHVVYDEKSKMCRTKASAKEQSKPV